MKIKLLFIFIFLSSLLYGQSKKNGTIVIKTSAQCEMCKEKIEKELTYTKGIKKVELDLITKDLSVTFQTKKLLLKKLRR